MTERESIHDILARYAYVDSTTSYDKMYKRTIPEIKKVIFNDPATIIFWKDGTKTVVKTQNGELFDPEKGMAMAIAKKAMGNQGNYFEQIKKYIKDYEPKPVKKEERLWHIWFTSPYDGIHWRYEKEYKRKCDATRMAKQIFARTGYSWIVDKVCPWG